MKSLWPTQWSSGQGVEGSKAGSEGWACRGPDEQVRAGADEWGGRRASAPAGSLYSTKIE